MIKTFEAACKQLGYDPKTILPDVSLFPTEHQKALIATAKLYIITEALNEGWKPDWSTDEYKWFQWWDLEKTEDNPTGFRFDASLCDCDNSYAGGGSRLCFKTKALCEYAAKQFLELYKDMMVIS